MLDKDCLRTEEEQLEEQGDNYDDCDDIPSEGAKEQDIKAADFQYNLAT